MRRWVWRGLLVALGLMIVMSAPGGVKTIALACAGSLEGYRYLANVRTQLAPDATSTPRATPTATIPPTPTFSPTPTSPVTPTPGMTPTATSTSTPQPTATSTPSPSPTMTPLEQPLPVDVDRLPTFVRTAGSTAIGILLRVKQSDAFAYPAHVAMAHGLDVAGCGEDAVRVQWLKAGLHASSDGRAERVAQALAESARDRDDLVHLGRIVDYWAEQQPRSIGIRRVQAAFRPLVR